MPQGQLRKWGVFLGVPLILLIAAVPIAVNLFRPAGGFRKALVELLRPEAVVSFEDILRRKTDFAVDFYGFRYRGNTSNVIDASVYYYGDFEKPQLRFLRDTLAVLPSEPVVIDVGANTGLYSLFASRYTKQVHAFEPFPPVLARLRATIDENKVSNILVHPVGLGETEAELPFFTPSESNLGTGSFVAGFSPDNKDEHLKLQIVSGDAYFPPAGITRVDFIKMDIEGYEKSALAGLRETLRRHRPIVLVEISIDPATPHFFKSLQELNSVFPENYGFFAVKGQSPLSGAYRLESFHPAFDKKRQYNVVARPNEKAGVIPIMSEGRSIPNP